MSEAEIKEAIRKEKNAYMREYRAKNKERIKANNERYWAKKAMKARCEGNAEATSSE